MPIDDFICKILQGLPIIRKKEDFKKDLTLVYKQLVADVCELDSDICGGDELKWQIVKDIKTEIKTVSLVIEKYLDGCHGEAYAVLKEHLMRNEDAPLGLDVITIPTFAESGSCYYRARMDDGCIHSVKDMFHVPNNKRGMVKTERYSASGYPCLYLGNTIYDCWEEMGRPSFDDLFFSGYKAAKEFRLYDLRKPSKTAFGKETIKQTLLRLVYVMACQFKVKNLHDSFKPEYIIPQIILELIISNNRKKKEFDCGPYSLPWGVLYTSTHVSEDFPYGDDYMQNMAIPVIDTTNQNCNVLASLFQISRPVCYRFEELKELFRDAYNNNDQKLREDDLAVFYTRTKMGFLESRIKKDTQFEQLPYIVNKGPDRLLFDCEGNPINVPSGVAEIEASENVTWHIETGEENF